MSENIGAYLQFITKDMNFDIAQMLDKEQEEEQNKLSIIHLNH